MLHIPENMSQQPSQWDPNPEFFGMFVPTNFLLFADFDTGKIIDTKAQLGINLHVLIPPGNLITLLETNYIAPENRPS